MIEQADVAKNLEVVWEQITEAALRAGRDPTAVQLVAVTKTFPADVVIAAYHAGQRHFGENRPEEGAEKIQEVRRRLEGVGGAPPIWHMIGHVQSRKAGMTAEHFDRVHSIDRLRIARRLSARAAALKREIPVLLECNVSGEAGKYGYQAANWERDADIRRGLASEVASILALPGLRVEGLMTVAPITERAESVRPIFASLRGLRDDLRAMFPAGDWRHLSMGMTDDFEVAVEEGATLVRVGRAIFGTRDDA